MFRSTFTLTLLSVLVVSSSATFAQVQGDKELLKLTAAKWRANFDAIRTWQGKVKEVTRASGGIPGIAGELETVAELEFALDVAADRLMFFGTLTTTKGHQRRVKSGAIRPVRYSFGGIRTSTGFYEFTRWNKDSGQRPSVVIKPLKYFKPGGLSAQFDPRYYLRDGISSVAEKMTFYYENAASTKMTSKFSVSRSGNLVTFESDPEKKNDLTSSYEKTVYDLAQGGNPVELFGREGARLSITQARKFEKVGTIWVPKSATLKHVRVDEKSKTKKVRERETTWIENVVNKPIPAKTFTLENLGIQKGDSIQDSRNPGLGYRYDPDSPPPDLAGKK